MKNIYVYPAPLISGQRNYVIMRDCLPRRLVVKIDPCQALPEGGTKIAEHQ